MNSSSYSRLCVEGCCDNEHLELVAGPWLWRFVVQLRYRSIVLIGDVLHCTSQTSDINPLQKGGFSFYM